jgi:hypothetical protein
MVVQEQEGIQEELVQGPEAQAGLENQPNPSMIPLQELSQGPEEKTRRSSRLAKKSQGMYINAMDKAIRKKKNEAAVISGTTKSGKSSSNSGQDQEEDSKITPPFLLAEEVVHMRKECGFDANEEGELLEAAARMELDG